MKHLMILITAFGLLTGCSSTIESFYNRQVVQDQLIAKTKGNSEIGTLAVTAQRRLIIANLKTGNFCSEPPAEAVDSISTALGAALKANVTADQNASAEFASNFARHANQLYKRSHTIQLFRDASFHLCVNAVNTDEYKPYGDGVLKILDSLINSLDKEVALYYGVEKVRATHPNEGSEKIIICDSSSSAGDEGNVSASINCKPLDIKIKETSE